MKVVIIEPNLKDHTGHVFEATRAIEAYLTTLTNLEYFIVCHKDINEATRKCFHRIYPLAEQSCFESTNYDKVRTYLKKIIEKFSLNENDLIVITTAHLNEIKAVNEIATAYSCPNFILQIHQYYPPLKDSDDIKELPFRKSIMEKFKDTLSKVNHSKIAIATTPVDRFSSLLKDLSGYTINELPVPFLVPMHYNMPFNNILNIGLIGDGRKEKGMLNILQVLSYFSAFTTKIQWNIQIQNPRGFRDLERDILEKCITNIKKQNSQVNITSGPLSSMDYYNLLCRNDCILLPYDPDNYIIRMSGIAVECGMLGIPIIASEGTSFGEWISKGQLAGLTFRSTSDISILASDLLKIISLFNNEKGSIVRKAKDFRGHYLKTFSAENYINSLFIIYEQRFNNSGSSNPQQTRISDAITPKYN
jgi:hypothetical protein